MRRGGTLRDVSPHVHHYQARCSWRGSTAGGYGAYDRSHTGSCPPASPVLNLSSDPAFNGDPAKLDPEQLLVLAATSCQLLSFLSIAARAGVTVLAYDDDAEASMTVRRQPMALDSITLRPKISVTAGTDIDAVIAMVHEAHEECYIANSLRCDIAVVPEIAIAPS